MKRPAGRRSPASASAAEGAWPEGRWRGGDAYAFEQALFIEQEVERFLDIKDRPVRGELPR